MRRKLSFYFNKFWLHIFFVLLSLSFILPFILIVSVSFTKESAIAAGGYKLIPAIFSVEAYKYAFNNPTQLINAYVVTIFISVVGTFLSVFIMALVAYPLSRRDLMFKKTITFLIFFTMLFNGGLVPTYILVTQYLHLKDTIWVYIFTSLANAYNILILRTFFCDIHESLIEAAKIDGAREFRVFFQIIMPLSKPVLATVFLLCMLSQWNNWFTSLIYITDDRLYTLQYLLQRILREVEFLKGLASNTPGGIDLKTIKNVPTESLRFAMCVIAAGPMILAFPFFQKYFSRGLTVGAVKG